MAKGPAESLEVHLPDSLKAKFSIEVNDSVEGSHSLSGVLFAVPYKRYRMEFSGPMGIGVASVLWTRYRKDHDAQRYNFSLSAARA